MTSSNFPHYRNCKWITSDDPKVICCTNITFSLLVFNKLFHHSNSLLSIRKANFTIHIIATLNHMGNIQDRTPTVELFHAWKAFVSTRLKEEFTLCEDNIFFYFVDQTYKMTSTWVILLSVSQIDMNYMLLCLTTKSKMAPAHVYLWADICDFLCSCYR